ncbi:hypothetical protein HYX11_02345 [Candidatus Woesearchaeota archaeon]|nr:hypothetical protein [Candidatus Woesearchaeota archaeon]
MFKVPLAEVKERLLKSGKITPRELEERIKTKINDLSGLISEEGAAHIIANELGIELFNAERSKLKIKEIYAGMRGVSVVGKVVRKFEVREFAKGDKKGKVCSIILGDNTGTIRVVFWNDQADLLTTVSEEDILLIKDGYVKENNNNKEVHLGERAKVEINPEGEKVEVVRQRTSFERKKIEDLKAGEEGAEVLGTIVQVFDPRFFNVCSTCGKRVVESNGIFNCAEHNEIKPALAYVLNLIVDDGSGTIRSVLWKNQIGHLLGKEEEEMSKFKENIALFEEVKTDLLGEQLKLVGRVQHNQMFDRLELNVQMVEKANVTEEIARLEKVD